VYVNGQITAPSKARISALDRGFLYGDALFETMRAYGGKIFRLDQHLARLSSSATFLGFDLSLLPEPLEAAVRRTLTESRLTDAYVRLTVSRGTGSGLVPSAHDVPTVMVAVKRFTPYPAHLYERGAELIISSYRRDESSPLSNHKITSYLIAILAKQEAAAAHRDDAMLLNNKGDVAEATVANVFVVKDGRVITPPVSAGILPGITRAVVIEICRDSRIPCAEENITPDQLTTADEVFLTNTLMEIMPVRRVGDTPIDSVASGPAIRQIASTYRRLVTVEAATP
jgi:branched-chain amino acid aminotransferase